MTIGGNENVLGGFRLRDASEPLGQGGQGRVHRAVCESTEFPGLAAGDTVALKVMPESNADDGRWQRLEATVSALSRLDSPNVVRYYGCFRVRTGVVNLHVAVMEFLEGETLRTRLARTPGGLDADAAVAVVHAAATGLAAAATAGFVHRDVTPANVFLCADGKVKVIDFEMAGGKASAGPADASPVGSCDYMAPERKEAEFRGDVCADVFSLGAVLHESLFGRLPYADRKARSGFAFFERWSSKTGHAALAIDGRSGRIMPGLDEVLKRALAVDRRDRFPDFAAFAAALASLEPHEIRSEHEVYRIVGMMGEGGFGEVFRARRLRDGAVVALKHLKRMDDEAARRFRDEARAMAAADDAAFVRFYEYFEAGHAAAPQAYLAMAYLEGMPGNSLRDALRAVEGRGLPAGNVLAAFARYAHGLAVLHSRGIIHRDLKPSNLYFPADAEKAAIMDLGIALNWNSALTQGLVPGTPDYMPPEVIVGLSRGTPASDVYALGCCLYEALTGRPLFPPFKRGSSGAIEAFVIRARQMRPPRLDAPLVVANPDLERLLRRMTEPEEARRMSSAAEAEMELLELQEAFERGDWQLPPDEPAGEVSPLDDGPTADAVTTADMSASGLEDSPPIPFLRRIIRNRRELMLVLAMLIELASMAVIVWQRPRPVVLEAERRQLAERLKISEAAREKAERKAAEAAAAAQRIQTERAKDKGR